MRSFTEWIDQERFYIKDSYDPVTDEGGEVGPIVLFPWQSAIFDHVLTPDEDGLFPYTTIVYSTPKKGGKTACAAAITGYFAEEYPGSQEIFMMANDKEQAIARSYKDLRFHFQLRNEQLPDHEQIEIYKSYSRLPSGTEVRPLAQEAASAAGSRHVLTVWDELWAYDLTKDTEVYTREGWKYYNELNVGEEIATWKDGEWEWNSLEAIYTFYREEIYQLNHRRADMALGATHRVLGKFKSSGEDKFDDLPWEFRSAREASDAYEGLVPVASNWNGEREEEIRGIPSIIFMRFLGYYIAEGWSRKNQICIAQSQEANPDHCADIEGLLNIMGVKWYYSRNAYRFTDPELASYLQSMGRVACEKKIPGSIKGLHSELLSEFLTGYLNGDGWVAGNGFQCSTTSPQLADDLMEIGIKCGWIVRYMGIRPAKNENSNDIHRMSFTTGNICYHRKNWSVEDYHDTTFCVKTENETFLARRNGNVFWTGNSSDAAKEMWSEMTQIKTPGVKQSIRLVVTYAGYEQDDPDSPLRRLYDMVVDEGKKGTNEFGGPPAKPVPELEHITDDNGNPVCWHKGKMFVYWDHVNRMPWMDEEYYEEQRANLTANQFLRLHKNQWVSGTETFVPIGWWDRAIKLEKPLVLDPQSPYRRHPLTIGVDVGYKQDSSAAVAVWHDPGGQEEPDITGIAAHKIWEPGGELEMHMENEIVSWILELAANANVSKVVCDPSNFYGGIIELRRAGLHVEEFNQQGSKMAYASSNLFSLLKNKSFVTYDAPDIRQHLLQTVATTTGRGYRIKKESSRGGNIDSAVALAMACYDIKQNHGVDTTEPLVFENIFHDQNDEDYERRKISEERAKEGIPMQLRDHMTREDKNRIWDEYEQSEAEPFK